MGSTIEFRELLELPSHIPLVAQLNDGRWASYGTTSGTLELRTEICRYERERTTLSGLEPEAVIVTHGATQATRVIFEWHRRYASGRVHIPTPGYPCYWEQSAEHGERLSTYSIELLEQGSEDQLLSRLVAGDLLVINSPHNPTGQVVKHHTLSRIIQAADQGGWFVLVDAVYDELCPVPPYRINITSQSAVIYVNSMSKALGAADLRIGWVVAPNFLRVSLLHILESHSVAVSVENQLRATMVLACSTTAERARNRAMIRDRSRFSAWLFHHMCGLEFIGSGGPYGLARVPHDVKLSKLCWILFTQYRSVLISGEYFRAPENTCRIPLSMSAAEARRTARVLRQAIESMRIENLPLTIAETCSQHSSLFLLLARTGLLKHLEQLQGTVTIKALQELVGPERASHLIEELCTVFHQLGWLRYRLQGAAVRLTKVGRAAIPYLYYHWLIAGAYRSVLADPDGGTRDLAEVGLASCQMSRFGAFPLLKKYIEQLKLTDATIIDIGCGSGEGTVELAIANPDSHVIGLDMCEQSINTARSLAVKSEVAHRVSFHQAEAMECLPTATFTSAIIPVFAFVLHELVGQQGIEAVVNYLQTVLRTYPHSFVLVVEPDIREREDMADIGEHALAFFDFYWKPYYLIHQLTQQKLLSRSQWREVFDASGYSVLQIEAIPPLVDPCGIELGFLLCPKGRAHIGTH